jgi:signal transduction histidine kinase
MNPYNFAVLFFSFCSFIIGLLIWLKRQDRVAKYYLIFSSVASIWGIGFSMMVSGSITYEGALRWSRFLNLAAIFIPPLWVHFTLVYTDREANYKTLIGLVYVGAIAIGSFVWSPFFVVGLEPAAGFNFYTMPGPLFHFFTGYFFFVFPIGFFHLFSKMKTADEKEKFRLKGLAFATFFGFLGGAPTFLPCYGIAFPQYGLFLMPIYPFVIAYFMMREQLFDIEQLAEAAHRGKLAAIGILATSINHEIRNPLYVIQGLAQSHLANSSEGIYRDSKHAADHASEILKKTEAQATRAMEIMKSFALFAKQETNEKIRKQHVNLNDLIENIIPLINHELELDKIKLIKEIPEKCSTVEADPRHLEQILFNLIVNACQAMKSKEIEGFIRITAERQNGHTNILIEDNGPGIPTDKLKRVFEPFYTTKQEGTGLGLYITKQLVERNGGKISVNSSLEEGTQFTLTLPAK